MSDLFEAIEMDRLDKPREAAEAYERALSAGVDSLDAYRNLIALYIASLDHGYSTAHHLERGFIEKADMRIPVLLEDSSARFGEDAEMDFWGRYYRFKILGQEWDTVFPPGYGKAADRGDSLLPYFALFLRYGVHEDKLLALIEATRSGDTQRERELHGMASSALKQRMREKGK